MLFYILQVIGSGLAYYYLRKNLLRYFGVITSVYFIAYFGTVSYDVTLSVYFLFIILGIGIPKKIEPKKLIICIWLAIYTVIGFIWQDALLTMTTLVTRYAYIIVYVWVLSDSHSKKAWKVTTNDYRFLVWLGLLTEVVIIALVWLRHGFGVRVVTGHQPIGAGFIIVLTTIVGWCYFTRRFSTAEMLVYNIISGIIVILSGTRGYMIIMGLPLVVTVFMYLLDAPGKGKRMQIRMRIFAVFVVFTVLCLFISDVRNALLDMLRLSAGLGYRENENYFVKAIIRDAPWLNKLLGFGFGGAADHLENFMDIVYESSWNRSYMISRLQAKSIFHNYWYTVLFKQGIVGFGLMTLFYLDVFSDVYRMKVSLWIKLLLYTTIVGNVISATFRVSATCSIFEFLVIAFFIKMINRRTLQKAKASRRQRYLE